MRDMLAELGIYVLVDWATYNGGELSREFDTATGGVLEQMVNAAAPGDHMYPSRGVLMIYMFGTVGSACTNIDIDHRDRPGAGIAWAELASVADTANAAGLYVCEFFKFKRVIRVTWTVTTTTMAIFLLLDRGKRDPVLNWGRALGGYTELAPTYA